MIALCNVLLLRGDLQITPADRPAVSYSYLSSLLADYLLTTGNGDVDLSAALSILPRTQYGLDVNVRFDAPDSFTPSTSASAGAGTAAGAAPTSGGDASGELALFKLCGVRLVHGWLPDPADRATYEAVLRAGDYDRALDKVVEGDEIAKGVVLDSSSGPSADVAAAPPSGALGSNLDRIGKGKHAQSAWTDEQANSVNEGQCLLTLASQYEQLGWSVSLTLPHHPPPTH